MPSDSTGLFLTVKSLCGHSIKKGPGARCCAWGRAPGRGVVLVKVNSDRLA